MLYRFSERDVFQFSEQRVAAPRYRPGKVYISINKGAAISDMVIRSLP